MDKRVYAPAMILALGFSCFAFAQSLPPFEEVDQNSDGAISRSEAAAIEGLDFAAADTDQNGLLDRAEYSAAAEE